MQFPDDSLTVRDLVYTTIPRLNTAQRLVENTLATMVESSKQPQDLAWRLEQQRRFQQIESHAIHMNLEHLLKRYQQDVDAVVSSEGRLPGAVVEPDEMEADAIARAKEIYLRVRAYQTGARDTPY